MLAVIKHFLADILFKYIVKKYEKINTIYPPPKAEESTVSKIKHVKFLSEEKVTTLEEKSECRLEQLSHKAPGIDTERSSLKSSATEIESSSPKGPATDKTLQTEKTVADIYQKIIQAVSFRAVVWKSFESPIYQHW